MTTLNLCPSASASSGSFRRQGRAKRFKSAFIILFTAGFALSLASCKKPEPEAPKVIEVSSSSRLIVSQGLSVNGAVTVSETFAFTAPDSWTASVTDTKASAWVTLSPSSGPAGNVVMNVTAKANDTFADREAKVTITSGTASVGFTVRQSAKMPPVESVKIVPDAVELTEGETTDVLIVVEPAQANHDVTWSSDDESIATAAPGGADKGTITAAHEGVTYVKASIEGKQAVCKVTVKMKVIPAEYIALNTTTLNMKEGETETLQATVYPLESTDKVITWTSDYPNVATVDANGTVTAVGSGSTSVTARCGSAAASCLVSVARNTVPVESITLNKSSLMLMENASERLIATVLPEDATDKTVNWSSNNTSVATVDTEGLVKAIQNGSCTITATAGSASSSCQVSVDRNIVLVTSVTLDKTALSLKENETARLTATVLPENATDKTVTWTSGNTDVAAVGSDGTVYARNAGTVYITATAGNQQASCAVTVTRNIIEPTGITLNKTELTLAPNGRETLFATVLPENATDKSVTWSGGDPNIATIGSDGMVYAVGEGTTTVTASTANGFKASCNVTVKSDVIPATRIILDKTELTLQIGSTGKVIATVSPENATDKTVTWSSELPGIASVGSDGTVYANSVGSTIVIARAGNVMATCKVNVVPVPVSSITLNMTALTLDVGGTDRILATVGPDNATDKTVTWTSSDPTVVFVDGTGQVTAYKPGKATITAKAGDKTATCTVTVNPVKVTSVSLNKTELELKVGASETLTATVAPENATDKTVTWTSQHPEVATVDANGKVTAVAKGSTTITAKAGDVTAVCSVTTSGGPVTAITLDKTELTLLVGASETLTATVSPDDADDKTVNWTSSDTSKATVDDNGKVTAVAPGTATITATAGEKSATCTVTVNPVSVTSVTLNKDNLELLVGASETLTATVAPDNATYKTVTWTSSDTSKATVDDNGKVTAVAPGTVTITAAADGKSATCTVTVPNPAGSFEGTGEENWD